MFRFFVNKKINNYFPLDFEILQHIKVVRIQNKPFICIYEGRFYITHLEKDKAIIDQVLDHNHEFQDDVILAPALLKSKNFEWLIQKATELGISKIMPVISQHTNNIKPNLKRWTTIIKQASQQSFRNNCPQIDLPVTFEQILKIKIKNKYILDHIQTRTVKKSFPQNSLFLVGPEGGWTSEEIDLAKKNGFEPIWLGKRILRAETASIFVLARIEN